MKKFNIYRALRAEDTVSFTWLGGYQGSGTHPMSRWAFLRPVACSVIATIALQAISPLVHAMQRQSRSIAFTSVDAQEKYGEALLGLKKRLASIQKGQESNVRAQSPLSSTVPKHYQALAENLAALYEEVKAEHQVLNERWRAQGVSEEIIARQADIESKLALHHETLIGLLRNAANSSLQNKSEGANAEAALKSFMQTEIAPTSPNSVNLENLPWQAPLADPTKLREPLQDSAALSTRLQKAEHENTLAGQATSKFTTKESAKAAPGVADLAPTADAPHTQAIIDLANSLNKNPVAIYKWVHDNIAFMPTYGSVQGAEDTLNKKSGNAFDQASLLIALLRSAGIPARYVVGTIEVPEDNLRNWLGDFKTIDAAQQILGQGGIPNIGVASSGKITSMRLEHAWVEAYVSFFPSRGSRHIGGVTPGDTWIPMDPSYKQYNFRSAINLSRLAVFNADAFVDAAKQGAEINEAEGWVQNHNQANIAREFDSYQARLATRIKQYYSNPTVGNVIGKRSIQEEVMPYFASALTTKIVATGAKYSALPDSLRAHFRYRLYADDHARANEKPDFTFQMPTSELAGKTVTLNWLPATPADGAAIAALLPAPNSDGSPFRPEQLPTRLPSSINLRAEIRVEGEAKASSGAYKTGSVPIGAGAFTRYTSMGTSHQDWDETPDNSLAAGQQSAIGLSIQGVSHVQLETLKNRLVESNHKLEQLRLGPSRSSAIAGLNGDTVASNILISNIWTWFAEVQNHAYLSSVQALVTTRDALDRQQVSDMYDKPALSYGLFHADARPIKMFGSIVTGFTFTGVVMDIGHIRDIRWVKDTNLSISAPSGANAFDEAKKRWVTYNRVRGQYMSLMEGVVPQRIFSDPNRCNPEGASSPNPTLPACARGMSAVKAIEIASQSGQKIYTITKSVYENNRNIVSNQLGAHSLDTKSRVQNALNAGQEVTIHESPVSQDGWVGSGFIILDPSTGGGAYTIEGGANGGWLYLVATFVFAILALVFLAWLGPFAILGWGWMLSASLASAGAYLDAIGATFNWDAVLLAESFFLAIFALPILAVGLTVAATWFASILGIIMGVYGIYAFLDNYFGRKKYNQLLIPLAKI